MEFHSFAEFIAMGRHGFYVWLSYGLTFLVLAINIVLPILDRRRLLTEQARRLRRERSSSAVVSEENNDASTT
ncbi:heme exporter protein CcmD [Parathalassolituus penaei]|uniref:Heme exporter protein D n=1 Tax=Parathalassolituus penaei TaxID=2997323 RepID=A0A9X3EA71_9GAMM|nr:heme exporter protein CcmD [Parathalassolituus penaei]MCY0963752.1 heme exporter protein CcmD [Parathalassolituus penaei]